MFSDLKNRVVIQFKETIKSQKHLDAMSETKLQIGW